MFLIKGENEIYKEFFTTLFISIDMKDESFLYIFPGITYTELVKIGLEKFNTVNELYGDSFEVLTKKHHLLDWFTATKFPATLPAIISVDFKDEAVEDFFKQGSKVKFLKFAYGFAGQYVYAVDSLEDVKQIVKETHKKDLYIQPGQTMRKWVLQDMLEDVATFDGYKFHLRVWLVVVVQEKETFVYISNYHTYEFAADKYDTKRLKDNEVWDTHKYKNPRDAFFPMELPDHWSAADGANAMEKIKSSFKIIYEQQHMFKAGYKLKNGFQIFGADVLLDSKQNPYILEINNRPVFYRANEVFIPEYLHLGLGGSPLKLFSTLYGTPIERSTPFSKSLQTFYKKTHSSAQTIQSKFRELFLITLYLPSAQGYLLYQKIVHRSRTTTRKIKKRWV